MAVIYTCSRCGCTRRSPGVEAQDPCEQCINKKPLTLLEKFLMGCWWTFWAVMALACILSVIRGHPYE